MAGRAMMTGNAGELMKNARKSFHLIRIGFSLYAMGGSHENRRDYATEVGGWYQMADVEEFVEETGTWKPATSLPGERNNYGGLAVPLDLVCG